MILPKPRFTPPLHPEYRPAILAVKKFTEDVKASQNPQKLAITVEQLDGKKYRNEMIVFSEEHESSSENYFFIERMVKFLLWMKGGYKVYVGGCDSAAQKLKEQYAPNGARAFDADLMGKQAYGKTFEIISCSYEDCPEESPVSKALGRHLDGYRIGFDLGASDRKAAAVINGEVVFSEEIEWDPVRQTDHEWHFNEILDSIKRAAKHLPQIDAIGGSSAGVYVDNQVRIASLFRGIPENDFDKYIKNIFFRLQKELGDIPFEVVNDGEVTALAGSMSLESNSVLGVAFGSSFAAGYVDANGNLTSWLNELAFVPVDYSSDAPIDEWSGDFGCGVQYFSQQAVARLIPATTLDIDRTQGFPDQLLDVQKYMLEGNEEAAKIYQTIGTYLGYTIALFDNYYQIDKILTLGRVTSGEGGEIILKTAQEILDNEFPDVAKRISIHTPNEKDKRHGQAVAAASLPEIS